MTHWGREGWFVKCLYNTGQAQHTKTHSPYQGKWFNLETEAKKHTTHEQTLTKKEHRVFRLHTPLWEKTENSTQVKSKAQTKQIVNSSTKTIIHTSCRNPDDH